MLIGMKAWIFAVILMLSLFISFTNPRGESHKGGFTLSFTTTQDFDDDGPLISLRDSDSDSDPDSIPDVAFASYSDAIQDFDSEKMTATSTASGLVYDFYRNTCPDAERIVRSSMAQLYSQHKNVSANILRLFFHDCFIQGCDASVLLDDSFGNKSQRIEKQAIPNKTLKGFDKVDHIKEELEKVCPGVVSCADILSLATRDGIVLAGGPFYPVFTGRRDSVRSYYSEALAEIPRPDDNITQTLHLFSVRGFNERETVSLLGAHNIGKISCEFIENRLRNFKGTGQADPSIAPDFLKEMRRNCGNGDSTSDVGSPSPMPSKDISESEFGMSYFEQLSSSMSSGSSFDTHYYRSLLKGRGLLFADQQLMADEKTARLVRAYASDDGSTFRRDFAWAMLKMSNLNVLTGTQGQIRLNCSLPLVQSLLNRSPQH
ncbi:putative Peroxidase 48 [Ziziphus jujuba]|uniref:peroxidase n=1 Tax=Ziziphus jujuba TaxID=326968 RepID=A0A6P3Z7J3_ZIZJJ|nr:putative Peroxidase 48 [Ziziphus jujuba]